MPPGVSIITVYYNTPTDLLRLFQSAKLYLKEIPYEFIIADNASEQNLSGEIQESTYLRLAENYGFGRASNMAAEKASAPVLFFVNPDCVFVHDCVPPLLETLKTSAIAGPKVLNEDQSIQLSFGPSLSILSEMRQKRLTLGEKSSAVQSWLAAKTAKPFYPDYVSGCALMIQADVFRKLNGFDENFFLYNEDVDLCKRATEQGHQISYQPSARIMHHRNRSVNLLPGISKTEYRKSQIYYYKKHHGILQNLLLRLYLCFKMEPRRRKE